MKPDQYLPAWFMAQYFIAAIVYRASGDGPRAAYWIFALGLTYVVTFELK